MRHWITDNFSLKLISLLLALILYLFVRGDRDSFVALFVPVTVNIPAERVLLSEPVERLKITVTGKRSALDALRQEELKPLSIDLSNIKDSYYEFTPDMLLLPPGVSVSSIQPPGFAIELDQQGIKDLEVLPRTTGNVAEGYRVASKTIAPRKVEASGPLSVLDELSAVFTSPVDLSGRSRTFRTVTNVRSISSKSVSIQPNQAEITVVIEPIELQQTFQNIPVQIQNARHITIPDPPSVNATLKGPPKILDTITPNRIVAIIDANDLEPNSKNNARVPVELVNLPEQVSVLQLSPPVISVSVQRKPTPAPLDEDVIDDIAPHPDDN